MMPLKTLIFAALAVLVTFSFTSMALAKEVNLFDQPKTDAKVIGKVDLAVGVVPIFTSKEGDWMKVGDPRDGNVGWIKSNEMTTPGAPVSFTYTQKIVNDKNGPHTVQLLQVGKPNAESAKDQQEFITKLRQQQQIIQQKAQSAIQDMLNEMNKLYEMNKSNIPTPAPAPAPAKK